MEDYKNTLSHIDIDRSLGSIEYFSFGGMQEEKITDFKEDIEAGNDSIELHLIKSKAYKEALILRLKSSSSYYWKDLLKEEQKTFGGSKIFYISNDCTRLLVLSLPNEMRSKVNMLVTRLNKINDRISRINSKTKKDNMELYITKSRDRKSEDKAKDDLVNFINQNLRV